MENKLAENYSATGTLIVAVSTAGGALPVEGALVTVRGSKPENSGVLSVVTTDRSGRTPRITLPAPPAADSAENIVKKEYPPHGKALVRSRASRHESLV